MTYNFDWGVIVEQFPVFLRAVWVDVWLGSLAFVLAILLGLCVAAVALYGPKPLRWLALVYTQIFRGVPIYVMLFWVYFGLASAFALPLDAYQSAVLALMLAGSGYTTEALRAGIMAVAPGQVEAGRAIGLSGARVLADIVLPQALRMVIAPLASIYLIMIKWSTLISVIAVPDMIFVAKQVTLQQFRPFEAYLTVALVFILVVSVVSFLVGRIEKRFRVPG